MEKTKTEERKRVYTNAMRQCGGSLTLNESTLPNPATESRLVTRFPLLRRATGREQVVMVELVLPLTERTNSIDLVRCLG